MKIAFNPSTVAALTSPPDNKDITFDLRGRNIFARGVKFQGTDTNTWRDIKINNVSIGSHTLDLRNGSNTTLTNTNGVVTINSTWRPVVDNLTSNSTTSSLSANQGRVLAGLINGKSDSDHNHDDRYVKKSGDTMIGALNFANNTWNKIGDDVYIGDHNIEGQLCIMGANSTTGLSFHKYGDASIRKSITFNGSTLYMNGNCDYASLANQSNLLAMNTVPNKTTSTSVGSWSPISGRYVFHQKWTDTSTGSDTANFGIYLDRNLTANMVLDGYYNSSSGFRVIGASGGFLKANGTIDNSTYLTSHQSLSNYYTKGEVDNQLGKYKLKSSIWVPETKVIRSNFRDFLNKENLHKQAPEELNLYRFFAQNDESNYSSKYNYPVVDSHAMVFSIDGNNSYIRSMNFDLRSNDIYVTSRVAGGEWRNWVKLLDSSNYSGILDSRYYTESEVNSLLDAKLNRQNLSYGTWNPRSYNLAADYHYNGGDLSISESKGQIHVSIGGYFWQNEGKYRVLDTSDVAELKGELTVHQYLSATDTAWYPLIWGGNSHHNTGDSTGAVYKSHDKLSWQTSTQTLYATHLRTTYIDLENNRGIFQVTSGGTSPLKGIRLPDLQSNGIGMFSKLGDGSGADEGGIIISADTSVIYNSFDTGWGLSVRDKDRGQTDISGSGTIAFGIRQDYRAYSLGGFEKSGSDNSYVLLGGGGHKLESTLNVANANTISGYDINHLLVKRGRLGAYNIDHETTFGTRDIQPESEVTISGKKPFNGWGTLLVIGSIDGASNHQLAFTGDNRMFIRCAYGTSNNYNTKNWATVALTSDNVASASKLQTARRLWGQSFDGTSDVNGTIYINNGNSENGAIILNNNVNTHARISAIGDQVVFNTGSALRFGGIEWKYSDWAGLKYDTVANTIYLGIADGTVFNYQSSKRTNGTLKLPGISNINLDGSAQIRREGSSQMWVNGRNGALLRETSVAGYHALWSLKTTNGSWDFGEYNAGSAWNNIPVLSYITDSNYNSGNNAPTYQIKFPLASGTVALTSNILNPTNYYWANVKISTSSSTTTSPTVHTLTATRVCAGHDPGIDNSISCSNWFRSSGNTGWYNTTYQGGWYMSDTSWIRTHNGVGIFTGGQIYAGSSIRMSSIRLENINEINSNDNLHINYRSSTNVSLCQGGGNVGIGTISPTQKLDVNGNITTKGFGIQPCYLSKLYSLPTIRPGDGYTYRCLEIGRTTDISCIIADKAVLMSERGILIKFNKGYDGQIILLKDLQSYGIGNGYFWVMPSGCKIIKADGSSTLIDWNQISNTYNDGRSRFLVYSSTYSIWIEFLCANIN